MDGRSLGSAQRRLQLCAVSRLLMSAVICTTLTALHAQDYFEGVKPAQTSEKPTASFQGLLDGRKEFQSHCLKCHDAQKSMAANYDFQGWLDTIDRMVRDNEASVPQASRQPIATYLSLMAGTSMSGASNTSSTSSDEKANATKKNEIQDRQLIESGRGAFQTSCVSCHDAEKSLSKTKSKSDWLVTINRMATKQGASIPAGSFDSIATYLASLSGSSSSTSDKTTGNLGSDAGGGSLSVSGTFSPTWRGGNDNIQNGGFFPDTWLTANWTGKALSGQVTACVSCHTTAEGMGDRIELVEAKLRLDISSVFDQCARDDLKVAVEGGRFIVPFGAFASQSNPAVYRTVTRPLIYNMGQRVHDGDIGDPVLPMPYSDEGSNISIDRDLNGTWRLGMIGYVVNGLQSDRNGINFDQSRDYVANNNNPSFGSRVTLGTPRLNFGSSIITGQSSPSGGIDGVSDKLYYRIYGYDATYKIPSLFRMQFEYAHRESDRAAPEPDAFRVRDRVAGYYLEGEYYSQMFSRLSYIMRYDCQDRRSDYAPDESSIGLGSLTVSRFTYGVNLNLKRAGLVMINHERWNLPGGLERMDVLGVRWVYSF